MLNPTASVGQGFVAPEPLQVPPDAVWHPESQEYEVMQANQLFTAGHEGGKADAQAAKLKSSRFKSSSPSWRLCCAGSWRPPAARRIFRFAPSDKLANCFDC